MADGEWYFCLKHQTVESGEGCRAADRMGPYATQDEAVNWRSTVDARNTSWDEEDKEWDEGPSGASQS